MLIVISGALAYDAFTSYLNPYLTVTQVAQNSDIYLDEEIQVLGIIGNGTVQYSDSALTFDLADEENTIKVIHAGRPDNFQEGIQAVVIGRLNHDSVLVASEILLRCPSKYGGEGPSLLADPIFLGAILIGSGAIIGMTVAMAWKRKEPVS